MKIRLLLDENLSPRLKDALLRYDPAIDVLRVGDDDAPLLSSSDPEILRYLERTQRALVTDNRTTMPDHIDDHFAAGGQHWGIFEIRPNATWKELIDALCLLWEASEAEEWIDQFRWIPL